jgi:hypothetical protein
VFLNFESGAFNHSATLPAAASEIIKPFALAPQTIIRSEKQRREIPIGLNIYCRPNRKI